jgi:hypothetical protein
MSVRPATARGSADRSSDICSAPSCWETGDRIEIVDDIQNPPVLCEVHRQAYLGVSS